MPAERILIDPVTRIEGHAKITIQLGEDGTVADARLHITQLRGFEKFCENRPYYEMPSLMARICGICPVSHLIASSKACDAILGVAIPENAARLRRIVNLAQILQSHALSVFHLSSPDLLLGMDAAPETRHLFGVAAAAPEVARDGIRLRQIGQQIIEILAEKRVHPAWVVPGGVSAPLTGEKRDQLQAMLPDGIAALDRTLNRFRGVFRSFPEEIACFANFPSLFFGLTDGACQLEYYDGPLRIVGADGGVVASGLRPQDYPQYLGEVAESDSFLKSAYYLPMGYPDGIYRVGPLARLNLVTNCGTPRADHELGALRSFAGSPLLGSFHYHQARLIEMLHVIERMDELLASPQVLDPHVRAFAEPNCAEGVGMSEAPRGTLLHHYKVDKNGLIRWANLIIATGQNNLAMNRGIKQVATYFVRGGKLSAGALNRVEAVIRSFDPCLSCSTHATGQMLLDLSLYRPGRRASGPLPAGRMKRPLVIGYGNPLRQDDGIGLRAAELLSSRLPPGTVDVFACHQLTPELALKLAEASLVLFFDAALDLAPDHVACLPVEPASWSAASHHLSPGELVDLAGQIGGAAPPVFLITGGAGQTDLAEGLTAAGEQTAARMANAAEVLLRERTSAQFFLRTPVAAGH